MPVHDPRMEAEKKRREEKIAASRASASPIQQRPPMQAQGGVGPSRPSPLAQAGIGIGKKLLGSALGPLGGVLGGLFNQGGPVHPHAKRDYNMHAGQGHLLNQGGNVPVQGYNTGGWLSSLFGPAKPRTSRKFGEAKKKARTKTTGQKRGYNMGGPISMRYGYNVGGGVPMGPLNPNGYNEGGPVAPTPIKRVMDEDKIEIQRETFERAESRKDMKFSLDEKRAAEKHAMDMKLKKAAAVTKKAPLAKK